MALTPGTRLGHYEILDLIGVGGMGEVYRAHDHKLKRDVALKLLPEQFARDPERLARFRREAQLLASLNHNNIAAIYGLEGGAEGSGEHHYLVMELVEGETLKDIVVRDGTVPVDEALRLASQIAEALEHAHEKTVIHRDLKPANVKVTPQGKVKVLDFGLAKAYQGDASDSISSQAPTVSASPTIPGAILGTPAYMSPEQAKGKTVDRRTDIWALGCVLYELLTGKPAFQGETVTEILGGVMRAEPDWSLLPEATPPAIRSLLRRCLRKDAQQRPRDAADIRLEIDDARAASAPTPLVIATPAPAPARRGRWLLLGAIACVVVAAFAATAAWLLKPAPPHPVERFVSALPPNTVLNAASAVTGGQRVLSVSPDGRRLVYSAGFGGNSQLYVRSMDALEASPLAGTEGAVSPFFSPDGEWIGFFAGATVKKISVSGGAALTLCNVASVGRGATWAEDGTIVFGGNVSALMKVSSAGGRSEPFTTLQPGEVSHRWPQFLPDGKTLLFTAAISTNFDDAQIAVRRFGSQEQKIVIRGGTDARYLPTGHLIYYRAGTLMAVRFDPDALEVKGTPAPVIEGVLGSANSGSAQYSVSSLGSLVYVAGTAQLASANLVWVDRKGLSQTLPAPPRPYRAPRLSPDGTKVAVGIGNDVWLYDIPRDTLTRFTFEHGNAGTAAVWTPDGKRVAFPSNRSGPTNLFWKPADGSGPEERLTTSENLQRIGSFSPDGRIMMYSDVSPKTNSDLWWLSLEGDRKPQVFLQTPFLEASGLISPDGRWVSYVSDESGRSEIYVRPFPGPGGKWQISTEGGSEATWSPKGYELFFRSGRRKEKMMVADYQTQPTFSAGKPRLLFEGNYSGGNQGAFYGLTPDGRRFLMMKPVEQQQTSLTQINVVLNWFEELKQRVPVP